MATGALKGLLAASVLLLFLGLGANTIWDANEAFYVETPRQMLATGDYVHPQFNGEPRMNKPVLSYWIVAGLYHLFGVSVTVERLGIAIGAVGILAATFVLGRALGGSGTAWLATLLVATAPRFVMFSRRIFIDIWVTMFMVLAMACFVLAEQQPARRRRWLWLMYAALGLGVLTKGPVALVFPAAAIGTYLLLERRLRDVWRLHLVSGALIVLAIVVPWWAVIYADLGWEPLRAFWLGENLGRYTESMQPGERNVFFYVPVVLGDLFPWSLFVIGGLGWGARALWNGESRVARLLMLWILWLVGVFSLSQSKQDLYIFPIVPALAALSAMVILRGVEAEHAWVRRSVYVTAGLLVVLGVGLAVLFGAWARIHQIAGANLLAGLSVAGALVATLFAWRGRVAAALSVVAGTMVATNYVFALIALPAVEPFKPVVPIVAEIDARTRPGEPPPVVAHYRNVLPSMTYYLGRRVEDVFDMPTLIGLVATSPSAYVLIEPGAFSELQARAGVAGLSTCLVSRHRLFEAKMKNVLEGRPWPELYLAGTGGACREAAGF